MKIAFVCTEKLPVPPIAGGAVQIYIDGILPYLSAENDITVFNIEYNGLPQEEVIDKVKYIRVPAKNKEMYIKNIKEKLDASYDHVHIFNRPAWVLPLCENLDGVNFSLSVHNEMFKPEKISESNAIKTINRVKFINTVSKFIADGIKKLYPIAEPKLYVVYSGTDITKYKTNWSEEGMRNKNELKKKYNIEDHKVVLYVGRLSVKKGVHTLFKAMKNVMALNPKTALVIVGSKWYGRNEVDDYTKRLNNLSKELKGPVIFTGFLPPSEIPAYYNLGDYFVCPSEWEEPLARVHYEALAAGLPIITTNRGGNAEVIDKSLNGIVVDDYTNPDAFSNRINFLIDNPHIALEMGLKGRKSAEEKYSWERVAKEVLKPLSKI